MRSFFQDALLLLARTTLTPHRYRSRLYRRAGMTIDPSALLYTNVFVEFAGNIAIGADVFVNHGVHLDGAGGVVVEQGVRIGPYARILTSSHETGPEARRAGPLYRRGVRIGKGTWIGAGATVLAGVSIGEGCIIAAGAVVTRDCLPHTLYAGVPAQAKRKLDRDPPTRTSA